MEILPEAIQRLREAEPGVEVVVLGDRDSLRRISDQIPRRPVGIFDGSLESAGIVSLRALEEGVRMALEGNVQALVTGPIHKPALASAGVAHPGQTELLAELTRAKSVGMLMCCESPPSGPPIRVLLATTHVPLAAVPAMLSRARVEEQVSLLSDQLRRHWRIDAPRIALCALNPHASDGGLFGTEEARVLGPAVETLRASGIDVVGPLPADTVFLRLVNGLADAVVAPYHDVGMAVFKTLTFGRGVNVTLGLPFPRTAPDHGTAFDRVGTGTAVSTSLTEALTLAAKMAAPGRAPEL